MTFYTSPNSRPRPILATKDSAHTRGRISTGRIQWASRSFLSGSPPPLRAFAFQYRTLLPVAHYAVVDAEKKWKAVERILSFANHTLGERFQYEDVLRARAGLR